MISTSSFFVLCSATPYRPTEHMSTELFLDIEEISSTSTKACSAPSAQLRRSRLRHGNRLGGLLDIDQILSISTNLLQLPASLVDVWCSARYVANSISTKASRYRLTLLSFLLLDSGQFCWKSTSGTQYRLNAVDIDLMLSS